MVQLLNGRSKTVRKKLEILRGAAAAFRTHGFDGAGMREIAEGLGMAPGALYYYFRNKRQILYFCQEYSVNRLLEIGREIAQARRPADAKLGELIRKQIRCMLDELQGSSAHIEFHALPPAQLRRIVAKRDQYEAIFRRIVDDGIRSGRFRRVDPKLATLAILGAINWTVRWYHPSGALSAAQVADSFADVFIRGLLR